jgi:hypothetical protein
MFGEENIKIICKKDYSWNDELIYIKGKEYHYSRNTDVFHKDKYPLIVSGCEHIKKEPNLAAICFSYEKFDEYFINYDKFVRNKKLNNLKNII